MQPRNIYRHLHCLDMDMYVCGIIGVFEEGTRAIVRYLNRRTGDLFTDREEVVFIKREEYLHWSKINS